MNLPEDIVPDSPEIWKSWLDEQEARTLRVFNDDPDRLIADYRREKQISKGYQGREILELLQNANDAAADNGSRSKVCIELYKEGFIIANTGRPFSPGGINSLRITDLSPKLRKKKKLIGQKGLGFRSILNWSRQPYITSGHLKLMFSESHLKKLIESITANSIKAKELIAEENLSGSEIVLPNLPFPIYVDREHKYLNEKPEHHKVIIKRCEDLKKDFDTVIGMPFDSENIFKIAATELQELRPEILLFAENIESISIKSSGDEIKSWNVTGDEIRILNIREKELLQWSYRICREKNVIPQEYLSENIIGNYEIIIALPQGNTPDTPTKLFSFFPTIVDFPFPVLCHATFELDSNRKYPLDSPLNTYIFNRTALLLAHMSEQREVADDLWIKAKTIARIRDYDYTLNRVKFGQILLNQAKQKNIIPTVEGDYKSPISVKRIESANLSWLPSVQFNDVCKTSDNTQIERLLNELDIKFIGIDDLRQRLNISEYISLDERAEVIFGLITYRLTPQDPAPSIFIDNEGNTIPAMERIYFYPDQEERHYEKPNWLRLHFVNEQLRIKLSELFQARDRRDLRQKLEPFAIQEYSLGNIASAIAVDAKRQIDLDAERASQYQKEMLIALFLLFPENEAPPKLPETTGVPLPNRFGQIVDSRSLYFSDDYIENGDILSLLYYKHPELLIASPCELGFDGNNNRTITFLKWLGVASWPRIVVVVEKVEREFLSYVLDNVTYPMQNERYIRINKSEFYRPTLREIKSIDCLQDILTAEPAAVLTWLALDSRADEWSKPTNNNNGELWDEPPNARVIRQFTTFIPSYCRWEISNTAWLPTTLGNKLEPQKCMLGERSFERIIPPPADINHPLFTKYKINSRLKRNAFENSGVMPDITHLGSEEIFNILLELPSLDPTGKYARAFYVNLLGRIDTDIMRWPAVPESFRENGKMWGIGTNGECYYQIKDLVHVDSEDFPQILSKYLNLVDLPKRVGSQKVKRLFGIEPFDRKKVKQKIIRCVELPESRDIQVQFQRVKPYLYYLRNVRTKQTSDIKSLDELEIVLCSTIEIEIEYNGIHISSPIENSLQWFVDANQAYLLYNEIEKPSLESDLLADAISSIIATLFNLTQGTDFASLIRCKEHMRERLLRRILGESNIPGFEEIKSEFDQTIRSFRIEIPIHGDQNNYPSPAADDQPNAKKDDTSVANTEEPIIDSGDGTVSATKKVHLPSPPPVRRSTLKRTFTGKHPGGLTDGLKRIIDGEICEKRAMQFESLEKRFVLKVSSVTGYYGPRCDLLSFESEEKQKQFIASDASGKKDISFVDRFIEVKGRSNENSPISLKGNELDAAVTYGEKYFLYRLYLEGSDKYVMMVLQNPLNHPEAVEIVKDIYVSRATLDRYDLIIVYEDAN